MAGELLSGPAGAAKSQAAREKLREWAAAGRLAVAADFQSIYAALTLAERGPDGRYPARDERLLPIVEYIRRVAITTAVARGIQVIATNSDGDQERREFLRRELGAGAVEVVVDPGIEVVEARLSDPATGELSDDCRGAVARWYGRISR